MTSLKNKPEEGGGFLLSPKSPYNEGMVLPYDPARITALLASIESMVIQAGTSKAEVLIIFGMLHKKASSQFMGSCVADERLAQEVDAAIEKEFLQTSINIKRQVEGMVRNSLHPDTVMMDLPTQYIL